ncbi:DUF1254 domain-containing protein [Streptomyces filamentosus]|uniref:DUF1254 domain-containing protein n=1 Tax=Streptomyces filamentosus TaxID=67294 RepID=UPI0033D33614
MASVSDELTALAAEAYVYGYPLVTDLSMVEACLTKGFGAVPAAPSNRFAHATELVGPSAPFVSINNDTIYSIAQVDLSAGPMVMHVPDTAGAYYVLQFVDAWTNNFAYVGRRATGTGESEWLIVPPGWAGRAPEGVAGVIEAPTAVVSVVGRFACDGPDDLPRVQALQKDLTLTPLHVSPASGLPETDPGIPEELLFFERMRGWMADFPPSVADQDHQDRFQPLGLLEEGPSPYGPGADPALVRDLTAGPAAGKARLEEALTSPQGKESGEPGAWAMNLHLFDHNLDHLGVGTLVSPEWRIADREKSYLVRAVAARAGLWGNHGYEAVYAHTFTDSDGRPLDGSPAYVLRFDQPPPVDAFWSLTMYETPDYHLVDNPADRYSIGDRTRGLVHGDDGSLTIHLQHDRPADPTEAANWLPTPREDSGP